MSGYAFSQPPSIELIKGALDIRPVVDADETAGAYIAFMTLEPGVGFKSRAEFVAQLDEGELEFQRVLIDRSLSFEFAVDAEMASDQVDGERLAMMDGAVTVFLAGAKAGIGGDLVAAAKRSTERQEDVCPGPMA
ncbi:hypothetical protein [Rhizobium sp. EC-SD404]|uniref:hypothetical protein n=1 Tax=Rhizobium sp. EC-SD404 TaxID=2038389 RepID=UPI00125FC3F0|nr:hypothetical protein [Rhizobium sp. EC-SD404]